MQFSRGGREGARTATGGNDGRREGEGGREGCERRGEGALTATGGNDGRRREGCVVAVAPLSCVVVVARGVVLVRRSGFLVVVAVVVRRCGCDVVVASLWLRTPPSLRAVVAAACNS